MKEYIAKEELLKRRRDINLANVPFNFIDVCPTVTKADICKNMVSREVVEQLMWERNLAIKQLNDLGIGLGEKKSKADICREFAEKIKQMMKTPEYGFCDIERIMEIALGEMEQ